MRILMVTSFPIPGEYDGTAMLPIKILRALKPDWPDGWHAWRHAMRKTPKRSLLRSPMRGWRNAFRT